MGIINLSLFPLLLVSFFPFFGGGKFVATGNQLEGVSEFLGIPFAQAPVDQLRWAPAEKMQSWNQIFQAIKVG